MKDIKKTLYLTALATIANTITIEETLAGKQEKCYNIVKAGKNDCASADGRHTCAGYAKVDGGANEWISLPHGTCKNIIGASTTPKQSKKINEEKSARKNNFFNQKAK